jgi:hypothetical protein
VNADLWYCFFFFFFPSPRAFLITSRVNPRNARLKMGKCDTCVWMPS